MEIKMLATSLQTSSVGDFQSFFVHILLLVSIDPQIWMCCLQQNHGNKQPFTFSITWLFAFDWDNVGFSCSNTVAKWNLSLSLPHEYHHPDSLQLTNRKDGSKNHYWESIEEAYYLVEVMVFVSVFPRRRFGVLTFWRKGWCHTKRVLWWCFLNVFWWGIYVFWRGIWRLLMMSQKSI
jgi:hypothetical protein